MDIGDILDDRYRIINYIGHGGMSDVYEARDVISRNSVAIKFMRDEVMDNPLNLRRFYSEAKIAASLSHDNIVRVYNSGTFNSKPYIVTEYIKGLNVQEVLDSRGSFSIEEALSIMLQLTSALAYAHEHRVIHRDVKPTNMFLLADGTIKLADFGIAEVMKIRTNDETKSDIIGSVHYLAPEISQGKIASIASDIYAAGITFFELITGHLPFGGNTPVEVAVAHIRSKMPSPKKYIPDCPKEIERIINVACNKDPSKRYLTCDEFHEDLLTAKQDPNILKQKKGLLSKLFGFK